MSPRLARRCCWFRTLFPRETLVYIFWHKGGQTFWACKSNLVLKTRGHDQKSDFKSQFWKASNEKISPGVGEVFFNIIKLVLDIYLFRVLIGLWQRKIMNRVFEAYCHFSRPCSPASWSNEFCAVWLFGKNAVEPGGWPVSPKCR